MSGEGIPNFDAQAFLAEMQENIAREQAVAKERPTAKVMGKALKHQTRILFICLERERLQNLMRVGTEDSRDWTWHPSEGSLAARDRAWADQFTSAFDGNPVDATLEVLQRLTASTIEHLQGLARLMAKTQLVRAPISLARSAMEAASTAAFIVDSDQTPKERLRRALNLRLLDLGESRRETNGEHHGSIYQKLIDDIFTGATACGLGGKYREPQSKPLPYFPPKNSTQEMIQAVLTAEVGESTWRNMSAVAHSREATLLLILDSMNPYDGDHRRRAKDVAQNSVPALLAAHQLVPRLASYLGWDLSEAEDEELWLLQLWSVGGGSADEMIRDHLFGESS